MRIYLGKRLLLQDDVVNNNHKEETPIDWLTYKIRLVMFLFLLLLLVVVM